MTSRDVDARGASAQASGLRILIEHASLYLPVLLMGVLALATFWLLKLTPKPSAPQDERAPTHTPDYRMLNFSVRSFDTQGLLTSEITGAQARHFPDSLSVDVDTARIRTIQPESSTTATAQRVRANDAQTRYDLQGDVLLVRRSAQGDATELEFRSQRLLIDAQRDHLESPGPVRLDRGGDRITAQRMQYDSAAREARFSGQVRATLAPR